MIVSAGIRLYYEPIGVSAAVYVLVDRPGLDGQLALPVLHDVADLTTPTILPSGTTGIADAASRHCRHDVPMVAGGRGVHVDFLTSSPCARGGGSRLGRRTMCARRGSGRIAVSSETITAPMRCSRIRAAASRRWRRTAASPRPDLGPCCARQHCSNPPFYRRGDYAGIATRRRTEAQPTVSVGVEGTYSCRGRRRRGQLERRRCAGLVRPGRARSRHRPSTAGGGLPASRSASVCPPLVVSTRGSTTWSASVGARRRAPHLSASIAALAASPAGPAERSQPRRIRLDCLLSGLRVRGTR